MLYIPKMRSSYRPFVLHILTVTTHVNTTERQAIALRICNLSYAPVVQDVFGTRNRREDKLHFTVSIQTGNVITKHDL